MARACALICTPPPTHGARGRVNYRGSDLRACVRASTRAWGRVRVRVCGVVFPFPLYSIAGCGPLPAWCRYDTPNVLGIN